MSLILVSSSACKWEASWEVGSNTPEPAVESAPSPQVPTAPEPAPVPEGPTITKAQLQTESGAPASVFAPSTTDLVCSWEADGVVAGTEIVGAWIAVDTGGVLPANYEIDEARLTLKGPSTGTFTLSKSMKRWPTGSYRVEILLDGKLVKTVPYLIS